jgi:hypothetical protein
MVIFILSIVLVIFSFAILILSIYFASANNVLVGLQGIGLAILLSVLGFISLIQYINIRKIRPSQEPSSMRERHPNH